ncbi:MAG: hypothetical protein K2N25_08115 [Muribaculaceae bacterium]|nr:hypothetical protein [Muribaculaceae bacterium]
MKNRIITAIAASALLVPAIAQNYKVVVTTVDGEKTEFETSSVSSIRFENAPNYAPLEYFIDGAYTSKGEFGIYSFTLASSQPDQWSLPPQVGDAELSLELVGALSEDYLDAQLPEGYYRAGAGNASGQFDIQKSGLTLRLDDGEEGTNMYPIIDGTVDVRKNGDKYVIKAELVLLQGGSVALAYEGPLEFTPGMMQTEEFDADQEFTFTGAQARLYDNWYYPFVSDATLQFYNGEFNADDVQTEGYWLNLDTFMPKLVRTPDGSMSLADGVYSAEPREVIANYTNLPYTYRKGYTLDFWGTLYPAGSYLNKREKNGRSFRAYIVDGTMTVSGNGTNVVFDFVTDNGKKVKATYNGKINFVDFSEPDKVPDYSSTLTEDVKLDFVPGTVGMSYSLGDYIKEGLYQFEVMVTEPRMEHGDFIMLELSSEAEVLPDGVYTINNALEPFTGIKGTIDYGGQILYSWYGDLDSADEDGVQSIISPILGGSVEISTDAEGNRKLDFNLSDGKGHSITGVYEGIFYNLSDNSVNLAPAMKTPAVRSCTEAAPAMNITEMKRIR